MRWLVLSVAVHIALLMVLIWSHERVAPRARLVSRQVEEPAPMVVEMLAPTGGGGGGGAPAIAAPAARATHVGSTRARASDPWRNVSVRTESAGAGSGMGMGTGTGIGAGTGNGIGFGNGGGIHVEHDVPPPPPPPAPPPSLARKAKLIWPTRDLEVEDESALFVARVTVDTDGSVVGARMITNRPGSRADHAANAIWTFRYAPALDEHGVPVRSTFEQSFQVR